MGELTRAEALIACAECMRQAEQLPPQRNLECTDKFRALNFEGSTYSSGSGNEGAEAPSLSNRHCPAEA